MCERSLLALPSLVYENVVFSCAKSPLPSSTFSKHKKKTLIRRARFLVKWRNQSEKIARKIVYLKHFLVVASSLTSFTTTYSIFGCLSHLGDIDKNNREKREVRIFFSVFRVRGKMIINFEKIRFGRLEGKMCIWNYFESKASLTLLANRKLGSVAKDLCLLKGRKWHRERNIGKISHIFSIKQLNFQVCTQSEKEKKTCSENPRLNPVPHNVNTVAVAKCLSPSLVVTCWHIWFSLCVDG